jgi:hypothetical protein
MKSKPPSLIPGAALAKSQRRDPVEARSTFNRTLIALERELGGREELCRVLELAPATTAITNLITLLANQSAPTRAASLSTLATQANCTTGEILKAYQAGIKLYAQTLALKEVSSQLPAVTKDVMARALPQQVECLACHGTKKDDDGKKCKACHGKGTVTLIPDLDRQQVALDLGDLFPKKGGGIAIGITNTNQGSPQVQGGGFLEHLQQAVSDVLFSQPVAPEPAPIDAEIVPPDPAA